MRSRRYMRSRGRRLLPRHAAAHGFQLESGILSSFHRSANGLAHERRHFDAALLDVEYDGAGGRQLRLRRSCIWTIGRSRLPGDACRWFTLSDRGLDYGALAASSRRRKLALSLLNRRLRHTVLA